MGKGVGFMTKISLYISSAEKREQAIEQHFLYISIVTKLLFIPYRVAKYAFRTKTRREAGHPSQSSDKWRHNKFRH